MTFERIIMIVFVAAMVLLMFSMAAIGDKQAKACEAQGGVLVRGTCIDRSSVIEMK